MIWTQLIIGWYFNAIWTETRYFDHLYKRTTCAHRLLTTCLLARGAIGVNCRIVAPVEGVPVEVIIRRMLWTEVSASVRDDGRQSETLVGCPSAGAIAAAVRRALRAPAVASRHRSPTRRIVARVDASCGCPPVGVRMSVGVAARVGALK